MATKTGPTGHMYRWVADWAALPDEPRVHAGWAHNALVVTDDGHVVGAHPAGGQLVVFELDGTVVTTLDCGLVEAHGMCLAPEGTTVWVADCGVKAVPDAASKYGYDAFVPHRHGRVVEVRLADGAVVRELPVPDHPLYAEKGYLPTAVAVAPDGAIWVADGYGASLLHRFDSAGELTVTLTGEESDAGRFDCPHGLLVDRRRAEPELYVADRENLRLLVFDLAGRFLREVGRGELARPATLAVSGELLVVAELRARVTLLDLDDRVVAHLGDNEMVADAKGWPNAIVDGKVARQTGLVEGRFNSPHGVAVDRNGNLYVTEWLVGGRSTKLEPDGPS